MRFSGSFFGLLILLIAASIGTSLLILNPSNVPFRNLFTASPGIHTNPLLAADVKGVSTEGDTVVKTVIDGDTLVLSNDERVRLIGLNAPEDGQPYYEESKKALEDLVIGKPISIEHDVDEKDTYGRTLAYLYVGDLFVNQKLIEQGVVVIETIQPNVVHAEEFIKAQADAREKCTGIWEGLCAPGVTSCVQISKINADPVGIAAKDLNGEWIEITNTCVEPQNLDGYLLKDSSASNSYMFTSLLLKAKQKVKLHSGCGTESAKDIYWACPVRKSAIWNNKGDHAYLYDKTGKLVSEMSY